ncbi:MAG: DNA polymerase IV [Candidatus Riflebacteria bacterium]|nr:DNA polymerase IV [Candidatus Riflebacteria bacterium]
MHLDMDAFYASVEQADDPTLKGQPVIVGGTTRGVVSAASYEARRYGVRSAMPMVTARRLCPQAVVLPVRMDRYLELSEKVMAILRDISPLVEQTSIDEAFVDLSGTARLFGLPAELAPDVKRQILAQTSLTCSIGVAPNKFLAKMASERNKPDGLYILEERRVRSFLRPLPVVRIPGIGPKTEEVLKKYNVYKVEDVFRYPPEFWESHLGRQGALLYERALGIDPSPVVPDSEPKSFGAEDTLPRDTRDLRVLTMWLLSQAERLGRELRLSNWFAGKVTLKLKFADFTQRTKTVSLSEPTQATQTIFEAARHQLQEFPLALDVRLIGIAVSFLCRNPSQPTLFPDPDHRRRELLDRALDAIREKFGQPSVQRAGLVATAAGRRPR